MYNVRMNIYWPTPDGPRNVQIARSGASCYAALERSIQDLLKKISLLQEPEERETTCVCLTGFILPIGRLDSEYETRKQRTLDAQEELREVQTQANPL